MLGQFKVARALQRTGAWIGLLLMAACFVWMVSMPLPERGPATAQSAQDKNSFSSVVIDPGHGGNDSGAMCGNILEKDLTLDVAQRVDRLLRDQNVATLMTRSDDRYVSLPARARIGNRADNSIFVSIHFNEGERALASGVETYYADHQTVPSFVSWIPFLFNRLSDAPNVDSQSLAGFIQQSLVTHTQSADRGAKGSHFFVIRNVTHPAVLVECGFLTNKDDLAKLADALYREKLAAAITEGILRYRELLNQRPSTLAVTIRGGPPPPAPSANATQ